MTDKKNLPDVQFTSEFKRNLRSLAKKFPQNYCWVFTLTPKDWRRSSNLLKDACLQLRTQNGAMRFHYIGTTGNNFGEADL